MNNQDLHIVQLSDMHLRGDNSLSFRVVNTQYWLDAAAAHLLTLARRPDALVITGDLADSGDEHAYHLLRAALEPLKIPIFAVPGNHDRRDRMRAIIGEWCPASPDMAPLLCGTSTIGDALLVLLDTLEPGSHSGHCPPRMADWLEHTLTRAAGRPVLVFMHHPPFITGMGAMDEPFEHQAALEAVLRRHPQVRLCCGHMHRPIITQWAGCMALTAPSVSMQIDLDISPEGGDTFRMETPGYLLHHWNGQHWNTHVCQIPCTPSFSGPHPFVDSVNPHED
ncbi:MAG: phosphodiesterase [Desulfovibrionaceae bacterium]